mmetsp:Transcript_12301/g.37239  ORF Transcript_12301/g.37239 Transcript_12301/m.37239 type:complete len:391 (+) Transcript_12301:179-1351(+)|eukprot:CAMPEP_0177664302 /NCGR_PEP_ID=MMETSP0447-20121125/20414_1 /TAXON_ID=0 /ORGANISM="Stygamoeba regulata, Strain BSH-02190019" /LENGTH=390 /DNA_ID=CAMNT_0019170251 /DNA_START=115 /DNA_END=1287 /DNA_ORIENTATION=+
MNRNAFEVAEESSPLFLSESSDDDGSRFTADQSHTRLHTTSFFEQSSRFEDHELNVDDPPSPVLPSSPSASPPFSRSTAPSVSLVSSFSAPSGDSSSSSSSASSSSPSSSSAASSSFAFSTTTSNRRVAGLPEHSVPRNGSIPTASPHAMAGATENRFVSPSDSPKRRRGSTSSRSSSAASTSARDHSVVYSVAEGSFVQAGGDNEFDGIDERSPSDDDDETDQFLNRPPPLTITEQEDGTMVLTLERMGASWGKEGFFSSEYPDLLANRISEEEFQSQITAINQTLSELPTMRVGYIPCIPFAGLTLLAILLFIVGVSGPVMLVVGVASLAFLLATVAGFLFYFWRQRRLNSTIEAVDRQCAGAVHWRRGTGGDHDKVEIILPPLPEAH